MKLQIITIMIGTLTGASFANGANAAAAVTPDRVSVFKAPLVCPAAPQIGCGSASKPILLDLERQPGVLEAWLNRAGTRIAVVWKPESNVENRRNVSTDLKEDGVTELKGKSRDETVSDFLSGKGWYRGAEVDRLSEEEAGITAARFVRRVEDKTTLLKEKAEALRRALADAIAKCTTDDKFTPNKEAVSKLEDELPLVAGQYLNADQLSIFKEAVASGWRPLPNEK